MGCSATTQVVKSQTNQSRYSQEKHSNYQKNKLANKVINEQNESSNQQQKQLKQPQQLESLQQETFQDQSLYCKDNQAHIEKIIKQISQIAQKANIQRIQELRKQLESIKFNPPISQQAIKDMTQALQILFPQRENQSDLMIELKYLAKFLRETLIISIVLNSFQNEEQHQFVTIIKQMLDTIQQEKDETFDFGIQLELEIIYQFTAVSKNDSQGLKEQIQTVSNLIKSIYNNSPSQQLTSCQNILSIQQQILTHNFIQIVAEIEFIIQYLKNQKLLNLNEDIIQKLVKLNLILFKEHKE